MEYIRTIYNGGNSYSVFSSRKVNKGKISVSYGICIENSSDALYIPDLTTVEEIALCMVSVLSADMIMPDIADRIIYSVIS